MERVAFLIEDTGQRIGCMLNPEGLVVRRTAGLASRRRGSGFLAGPPGSDDSLLVTGGGRTEFDLDLLFDVDLAGSTVTTHDVRDLSGPLWRLCENEPSARGRPGPTAARFIWGKAWNVPVMVVGANERLERFSAGGVPQRSWLRLLLRRIDEPPEAPRPPPPDWAMSGSEGIPASDETVEVMELITGHEGGERLDRLAADLYGDPGLWRELAAFNGLDDPLHLEPGQLLRLPPRPRQR